MHEVQFDGIEVEMRCGRTVGCTLLLLLSLAAVPAMPDAAAEPADGAIDFNRQIRPILAERCFKCHGPDGGARRADLRLDLRLGATAGREGGVAVAPGRPNDSLLLARVSSNDSSFRMPPPDAGDRLDAHEIDLLTQWIQQGGEYRVHWSLVPPVRPTPLELPHDQWSRNTIDRFVLARLAEQGLSPSMEALRTTLIRRVSLDLIGLPPSPSEVDAFVRDDRPESYEQLVDRLLASPHYGERWARVWLDLARYADTQGYEKDSRRTIWRYRDWVIERLNEDMPFDRFTIEQIAGDLLEDPTVDQKIATAFHRNTMTNYEGGTDDEEFRVAAVVDRVNTTMQVWMGLTAGCAQCHAHKYDPISHREYYQLYAFFNQTEDTDQPDDRPRIPTPTTAQQRQLDGLEAEIADVERTLSQMEPDWEAARSSWAASFERPVLDDRGLIAHYELDGHTADTSGHYRHGEPRGEIEYDAGLRGNAVRLGGETFIDLGDLGDFERTDAFSYGGWIFPVGGGVHVPFARMDNTSDYRGYDVFIHERKIQVHIIHRWPKNAILSRTRDPITFDEWHHVMVTVDGSSKAAGVTVYVDGLSQPLEVTHDALTESIRTDKPFHLGRRYSERSFEGLIDEVRIYNRLLNATEVRRIVDSGIADVLASDESMRTGAQRDLQERYFRAHAAPESSRAVLTALDDLRNREAMLRAQVPSTPIMRELPGDQQRQTRIHIKGSFLSPGEPVEAGVPGALPPLPEGAPVNRLGLARWLVHRRNPLTARVTVNRFWEHFFGTGLVETSEDFGLQGTPPSHPELLDWLAVEFMDGGWRMKALCRLIVTSATYRQSSRLTPERWEEDPNNRWLARGPRFRLEAEMIRDQALAVSGLLSRDTCGPSVMPPQPPGVWQIVYSDDDWKTSPDADRYRRGLYTFWRRTSPYPSMITFDAPSRETCVVRRIRTNSPLQALVTLNDPVYVEAAQALARRVIREGGETDDTRVAFAFRSCLARSPERDERDELLRLFRRERDHFGERSADARRLAGLEDAAPSDNSADLAAWTVVCGVILNLDEFLTKN